MQDIPHAHLVGLADGADVVGVVAVVLLLVCADPEPDVAVVDDGSGGVGVGEGEDGRVGPPKVPRVQAEQLVAVPGGPDEGSGKKK